MVIWRVGIKNSPDKIKCRTRIAKTFTNLLIFRARNPIFCRFALADRLENRFATLGQIGVLGHYVSMGLD